MNYAALLMMMMITMTRTTTTMVIATVPTYPNKLIGVMGRHKHAPLFEVADY